MTFVSEEKFRDWLIEQLPQHIEPVWIVLSSKNVTDIILSKQDTGSPTLLFVEIKYHKEKHGRIGIGTGDGKGFQPEILMRKPAYIERHMRWIIVDEASAKGLFFSNDDVRANCAGSEISSGKQNNFINNLFEKNQAHLINIEQVPVAIAQWITNF